MGFEHVLGAEHGGKGSGGRCVLAHFFRYRNRCFPTVGEIGPVGSREDERALDVQCRLNSVSASAVVVNNITVRVETQLGNVSATLQTHVFGSV